MKYETININGLTIVLLHNPNVETVGFNILVKAGSINEEEKYSGIFHFLEHMAFKGTKDRSATQIADEFDMIGGHFNAYTAKEKTVYIAKVLRKYSIKALDLLMDIVQNSIFPEEEIEKEKKVVAEEIALYKDLPDDLVFEMFQETAFPKQSLGRSILGTKETVFGLTKDNLEKYIRKYYGNNNTIISVAGNFNSKEIIEYIKNNTSRVMREEVQKVNSKYIGGYKTGYKDLEQQHSILAFNGSTLYDKNYYLDAVLSSILGGGMSSRLFQEVREKHGLCYNISAFNYHYSTSGIFGIYMATSPEEANHALDISIKVMVDSINSILESEKSKAVAQIETKILSALENPLSVAEKLSSNVAIYDRVITPKEILDEIAEITVSKLQDRLVEIINTEKTFVSLGKNKKLYSHNELCGKLAISDRP